MAISKLTTAVLLVGTLAVALLSAVVPATAAAATLTGAGSTLLVPLEAQWAGGWSAATGDTVGFSATGSGAGVSALAVGDLDFAAGTAPLPALGACDGCVSIPLALSAIGVAYRIPGARLRGGHSNSGLRLTLPLLAQIYLGRIRFWNDPRITRLNRRAHLPHLRIRPVFRTDPAGSSYAFTAALAKRSSQFRRRIGGATVEPRFPLGTGATGDRGMLGAIGRTRGAIGYVAAPYLLDARVGTAFLQNRAGHFAAPGLLNIELAADHLSGASQAGLDVADQRGSWAYPIAAFAYAFVPPSPAEPAVLRSFLTYALTTGSRIGEQFDYAPLPDGVRRAALALLAGIA